MARPLKTGPKMDKDLRIPVTAEQRELVRRAVDTLGMEMAAWARPLLLEAAERVLAQKKAKKSKKRRAGDSNPPGA